jgi:protein SCO1
MIDMDGRTVTERSYAGLPLVVFFGFTSCPDVCPTTLIELSDLLDQAGPLAARIKVLFVTVDPERDTPEQMKGFLEAFGGRFTGLTGSREQVAAMARAWKVVYEKVPTPHASYTVDHTATVFLMTPAGRLKSTIDLHDRTPEVSIAKLRALARGSTDAP